MKELGIWDDSIGELNYDVDDNGIDAFPEDFDYSLFALLIRQFGGWVDFQPGIREKIDERTVPYMLCNLTTTATDENGLSAIVQNALVDDAQLEISQIEFLEAMHTIFLENGLTIPK